MRKRQPLETANPRIWRSHPGLISWEKQDSNTHTHPGLHCSTPYNSQDTEPARCHQQAETYKRCGPGRQCTVTHPRETAAETEIPPLLAPGMHLGRSHTKWSQPDRDNSMWVHTLLSSSILGKMKKQIQGTNLQDKKRLWDFKPKQREPKKKRLYLLPSFHMCRKSVSLTDTPQELDNHHPKLYLRFVQIPLWKKNWKKQKVCCLYTSQLTQVAAHCQQAQNWKSKWQWQIKSHDSEWPFSPVTAIMQQQARRAESPPTQHVGMDISNSHWKGQPEKKFFF